MPGMWETVPGGGGTTSPLTTLGDLYGFSTVNDRLPVGTDGYILQADSAQALGVGYSTRNFSLNTNQLFQGTQSVGATNDIEIGRTETITNASKHQFLSFSGTKTYTTTAGATCNILNSGVTVTATANVSTINGLNFVPAVNGVGNLTVYIGVNGAVSYQGSGTVGTQVGIKAAVSSGAGATTTTAIAFQGQVTGAATFGTVIGLQITNLAAGGTATWGFQVGAYQSYHQGPMTIGSTAAPATSAILDLSSTSGALLVPRMTNAQMNALTAADGMIVYTTDAPAGFKHRAAGAWTAF